MKDKKGVENVVADHLSRLTFGSEAALPPIEDDFPYEHLFVVSTSHGMLILSIFCGQVQLLNFGPQMICVGSILR